MKKLNLAIVFLFFFAVCVFAEEKSLLLDSFEMSISGGPEGTLDFGAGNGSNVEVSAITDTKQSGNQALKIAYDAVSGGYIYVARGFRLNAKNTAWLVEPESIDWKKYNAISFYVFGSGNKARIAFDLKDNNNEIWRFIIEDNFQGWKQIVCSLNEFFPRGDWQPDNAEKNGAMDFPIQSYQFEPLPPAKGVLYVDDVELATK